MTVRRGWGGLSRWKAESEATRPAQCPLTHRGRFGGTGAGRAPTR